MKRLLTSLTFLLTSMSFAARVVLPEFSSGEANWSADQATVVLDQDGTVKLQSKGPEGQARFEGQAFDLTPQWTTVFDGPLKPGKHPIEGIAHSGQWRVSQGHVVFPALTFALSNDHFQPLMLLDDLKTIAHLKLEGLSGVDTTLQVTDKNGNTQVLQLPVDLPLNPDNAPYLISGRQTEVDTDPSVLKASLTGETLDLYPITNDTPAFVSVAAFLSLPDEQRDVGVQGILNGESKLIPAHGAVYLVKKGQVEVKVPALPGTTVNAPGAVSAQAGENKIVQLAFVPQTHVTLEVEKDAGSLSDTFVFKAVATTDFESLIPATLSIQLPEGFTSQDALEVTRPISKGRAAELVVNANASRSGAATATAQLSPFNQQASKQVTVFDSSLIQVDVVPSSPLVDPGSEMTVKVTVKNAGTAPSGEMTLQGLTDTGITADKLDEKLSLNAGESKTFMVPVKVHSDAPGRVMYRTLLKSSNGDSRTETVIGINQPNLEMDVSGIQSPALPGEQQTIRVSLKNTGTRTAHYTLKNDLGDFLKPLSEVDFSGTLEPGQETSHVFLAEVAYGAAATGALRSVLTSEAGEQVQSVPVTRALIDFKLELSKDNIKMGEHATYTLTIKNPLPRPLSFRLEGKHADTVKLSEEETQLVNLESFEEGTLEFDALFTKPGSTSQTFTAFMGDTVVATPVELTTEIANVYTLTRESDFQLPFSQNSTAKELVLAHTLPEGSEYVAGSSTLNGETLPDPLIGNDGVLYWKVQAVQNGTLGYRVVHQKPLDGVAEPAVVALVDNREPEVLTGVFHLADYQYAKPILARTENAGAIKLPLAGTVFRNRDRISVKIQLPADSSETLLVNGEPVDESTIGLRSLDPDLGISTFEYIGLPLKKGKNTLTIGQEQIEVFLASAPVKLTVEPVQNLADGVTPIRMKVVARDANGLPSGEGFVDVLTSLEPNQPDVNPFEGGYQIRMVDGEALLELRPTTSTRPLNLTLKMDQLNQMLEVPLQFSTRQVGVGLASITAHLFPFNVQGKGAAYLETPLGDGQLQLAINSSGLEKTTTPQNFALRGDSSIEDQPLYGDTPVAFQYDHPDFKLAYREGPVPVDALPIPQNHVYLSGQTADMSKDTPQVDQLSGFVGLMPSHTRNFTIIPVGSRTYALPDGQINTSSERVEMITTVQGEDIIKVLTYGIDYVMDYTHGIIEFGQPLTGLDQDLNHVRIRVTYTIEGDTAEFAAWGAQVSSKTDSSELKLAAVRLPESTTATVVFTTKTDTSKVDFQASTDLKGYRSEASASINSQPWNVSLKGGVQSKGYQGLDKQQDGMHLNLQASYRFDPHWAWLGQADYDTFSGVDNASVRTGVQYSEEPFSASVRLGRSFGEKNTYSVFLGAAYEQDPWKVSLDQQINLASSVPNITTFKASYQIDQNTSAVFRDEYTWGGNNTAFIGMESSLGNTNYSIGYELPNSSGEGNRARLSANTTYQLDDRWSVDLKGNAADDLAKDQLTFGAGSTLKYSVKNFNSTLGLDYANSGSSSKFSLRATATGRLDDQWTLGFDGLKEFGNDGLGTRLNVNFAGRMNSASLLGALNYSDGTLARGNAQFGAHIAGNYVQPSYQIRGQLDARYLLDDADAFTVQGLVGANWYITDWLALGAVVRYLDQPFNNTQAFGYGIEGSVNVWNGVWATIGYNPQGFTGIAPIDSQAGFYFRLDFLLDENSFKSEDK
ncbi:hypothetical protein [Deinococcus roseus]|uniref:DUF11 domain-containing protein n=1 Tax=Deinococcus roseus TaxID=392414 RepID=A0ABQ2DGP2_9DEIO|nr:hypothetical protein [Deinococcus roseus]GGJ54255.1 hypothetical protein GCM10008938_45430 [Deinococcus roseus]